MSAIQSADPLALRFAVFTADLSQAAATYDLCTATGGNVVIEKIALLVTTAGATWTTVAFATNDTTVLSILAALAVVSVTLGATLATTWTQVQPQALRSTKKIQYAIVGATGTGAISVAIWYRPLTAGATLA